MNPRTYLPYYERSCLWLFAGQGSCTGWYICTYLHVSRNRSWLLKDATRKRNAPRGSVLKVWLVLWKSLYQWCPWKYGSMMVFNLPHVPLRFTATSMFFFFYLQEGKQLQKQETWSCRKVSQRKWWKRAVGMWWEEMRATKVICLPAVVYLLVSSMHFQMASCADVKPDLTVSKARPFLTRRWWGLEEQQVRKWQQEKAGLSPHRFYQMSHLLKLKDAHTQSARLCLLVRTLANIIGHLPCLSCLNNMVRKQYLRTYNILICYYLLVLWPQHQSLKKLMFLFLDLQRRNWKLRKFGTYSISIHKFINLELFCLHYMKGPLKMHINSCPTLVFLTTDTLSIAFAPRLLVVVLIGVE